MRLFGVVSAALGLSLLVSVPSFAQGWIEYASPNDFFSVNLPGEPDIEEIEYTSEYGNVFPGRVYRYVDGENVYSVTVVDYSDAERIHREREDSTEADIPNLYWRIDIHGSIAYAAWQFRQRDAEVTYDAWHYIDLVAGHMLQLTNRDGSRTFAAIYLHENRLYILEATRPANAPPPGMFQQSLSFLDEEGNRVRYRSIYYNPW